MRKLAVLFALVGSLFLVASAQAAPTSVFNGTIACTTQGPGAAEGQTWCGTGQYNQNNGTRSTVKSFDGVPIDVNVALPDEGDFGAGPYPLVYMFHGYGGGKFNFPQMNRWLSRGYAVLSQTNRGFHESCGTATSKTADPICQQKGFVRLDDTRYEVRDAQLFAGMLVDEGLVQPTKIAASGGSYGGGMSMALAALKDRTMLQDGSYTAWKSPNGTPMSLAVAIPNIPWTDLAYSLVPNGSNLDYLEDSSYYGPFGVMKQSYVNGLFASGLTAPGYYTLAGQQPEADLAGWKEFMDGGEPYDSKPEAQAMLDEITQHHSSYYIDHSQAPAPLLISSGFTDDLFPAHEATRYYNRTRAEYPDTPIALFFGSFGHPRGQNGSEVTSALATLENKWVEYYLSGTGTKPANDVTTFTQVCPDSATDAGPFTTSDWVSQSPGEIRLDSNGAQSILPTGGDTAVGAAFNPTSGTACAAPSGAQEQGTANYELAPAPASGYTVMGSPTVIADFDTNGVNAQVAARLVDVAPDGLTKTLVNRGIWRTTGSGLQVFQLEPNGWTVAQGHTLRLELLPFDGGSADPAGGLLSNFSRPSTGQPTINVKSLELRVPVQEAPGALGGLVSAPAPRVLPNRPGAEIAPGNEAIGSVTMTSSLALVGKPTLKGKMLTAKIKCPASYTNTCAKVKFAFRGATKKKKAKGNKVMVASKGNVSVAGSKTVAVKMKLTGKARKLFKDTKKKIRKRGKVKVKKVKGLKTLRTQVLINGKSAGFVVVKRNGKVK